MILIACGGTGGHLAPGIALAETLQERGHQCMLLISQKDVDTILIDGESSIDMKSTGAGNAGFLSIKSNVLNIQNDSSRKIYTI